MTSNQIDHTYEIDSIQRKQLNNKVMTSFSGIFLESDDIINFLKQELRLREVCQNILYKRIITQAAQERNLSGACHFCSE